MSKHPHIGLLTSGNEFFKAAEKLNDGSPRGGASFPNYYLYFHAIELALKSFLRYNGIDDKELKRIGHNLETALTKSESFKISTLVKDFERLETCIKMANPLYCGKELEYHYPGFKTLPQIGPVHDVAESLIKTLDSKFRAELKR